jgi:uridine kinase
MPSSASTHITLIDGRSGAGKTSYATELGASTGALVVSIDDVYPGWDGLDAGSWHIYRHLLLPLAEGLPGRYRLWSWEQSAEGDWVTVEPGSPVIVEGCGALRRESSELSDVRIWVELDDQQRRHRAFLRDGLRYAPHWDRWARQEERFLVLHDSPSHATVIHTMG